MLTKIVRLLICIAKYLFERIKLKFNLRKRLKNL